MENNQQAGNDSVLAMDYREFAKRHSISVSFLYQLISEGKGPGRCPA
jgi:hypothetical protein